MNANVVNILTLLAAGTVAFSLFGLTFSAVQEDGILRATSAGLMLGLIGFSLTVLAIKVVNDIGK
jgi:hypothetical protein